ncbi:MAG TPA: hypothetical protein VJS91_04580 [Nitrososphaeraceae archaeon]|nr:hypothetical protein [Nitrososphaeraceae archaeon]
MALPKAYKPSGEKIEKKKSFKDYLKLIGTIADFRLWYFTRIVSGSLISNSLTYQVDVKPRQVTRTHP